MFRSELISIWLLLLSKVKEYQEKGWAVVTFNTASSGQGFKYITYLRKKKE
jgi:general stress protein CsbA